MITVQTWIHLAMVVIFSCTCQVTAKNCSNEEIQNIQEASEFMAKFDSEYKVLMNKASLASWDSSSNKTDENERKEDEANEVLEEYYDGMYNESKQYNFECYEKENATLYRMWKHSFEESDDDDDDELDDDEDEEDDSHEESKKKRMTDIFSNAKMCKFNTDRQVCDMPFEPDLQTIMSESRNPDELAHYWKEFRKETGRKILDLWIQDVKSKNQEARESGYPHYGKEQVAEYESDTIEEDLARVMDQIKPFYKQLHAYVRKKLIQVYKNAKIKPDGPIPAHLLGDMYAQVWTPIFDIVEPFPDKSAPDVSKHLKRLEMKPIDIFILAEKFYLSMGMKRMTPHFWHYSIFEKPTDRKMECHGTAQTFFDGKDYRIRMCTEMNQEKFQTVYHEMGHIEYYMLYKDLHFAFQKGANPGFHEAIGDVISLSVNTPQYLLELGLLDKNETGDDQEYDISYLMFMALQFASRLPFSYIVDLFRNRVYNGTISTNELNRKWWELRLEYQGLCPPGKRTDNDFDIGCKYHIPNSIEYWRYYFASVVQFQIQKELCREAGHSGPLFKCNIHKNKKAGKAFSKMLSLGTSMQWQDVLGSLSKGKVKNLDAGALMEYFSPLMKWLKKQNKNEKVGWKSKDPMQCPQ